MSATDASAGHLALPGPGSGSHPLAPRRLPPVQAAVAGYMTQTFRATLTPGSVDTGNSRVSGFNWYLDQWYGTSAPSSDIVSFNADTTLTLNAKTINSTSPTVGNANWVGTAFGGGAYFEATLKFDPAMVQANWTGTSWPAWWLMSLEHQVQSTLTGAYTGTPSKSSALWPSQQGSAPGYAHFIEADIFEYDYSTVQSPPTYLGTLHDWSGVFSNGWPVNVTQSGPEKTKTPPASTNFNAFHRYGLLWVPATDTKQGLIRYYFDDVPLGADVTYSKYDGNTATPPVTQSTPWLFGIMDQSHMALILSTGTNMPVSVSEVSVWQRDASNNLMQ